MKQFSFKEIEQIMKALANKRRAHILTVLAKEKKLAVGEISKRIKLSFRSTSKHLTLMYKAGIVDREQASLVVYYRIERAHPVVKMLGSLFAHSYE